MLKHCYPNFLEIIVSQMYLSKWSAWCIPWVKYTVALVHYLLHLHFFHAHVSECLHSSFFLELEE